MYCNHNTVVIGGGGGGEGGGKGRKLWRDRGVAALDEWLFLASPWYVCFVFQKSGTFAVYKRKHGD